MEADPRADDGAVGELTDDETEAVAGSAISSLAQLRDPCGWARPSAETEGAPRFRELGTATQRWVSSSHVDGGGGPHSLNDREEEATHVRQTFRFMPVLAMLVALAIGCTAISGKSASENVDDAKITASVKTKLAEEKVATLTKVDVDTNKGTVYLTGNVENAAIKARATQIAYQVSGVREVVNNLKIQ